MNFSDLTKEEKYDLCLLWLGIAMIMTAVYHYFGGYGVVAAMGILLMMLGLAP